MKILMKNIKLSYLECMKIVQQNQNIGYECLYSTNISHRISAEKAKNCNGFLLKCRREKKRKKQTK